MLGFNRGRWGLLSFMSHLRTFLFHSPKKQNHQIENSLLPDFDHPAKYLLPSDQFLLCFVEFGFHLFINKSSPLHHARVESALDVLLFVSL